MLCLSAYAATHGTAVTPAPPRSGVIRLPVSEGHDIHFVPFSVDGEPFDREVFSITQDNFGFLWLGTTSGLYRYDGYNLKSYRHVDGDPNSPSDDTIRTVYKDRDGILWIGTVYGGLNRLDPTRETFTHYRYVPGDRRSLSDDQVSSASTRIAAVSSGLAPRAGWTAWTPEAEPSSTSGAIRTMPARSAVTSSPALLEDRAGNLWVGTGAGLNRMDRATGRFTRFLHQS